MHILVNDESIDFTLENEKTLGDVVAALQQWLKEEGFVCVEAEVTMTSREKRIINPSKPEPWGSTSIHDVETLRIVAKIPDEILLDHLDTIVSVFRIMKEAIHRRNAPVLKEIMEEYEKAKAGIDRITRQVYAQDDISISRIDEMISSAGILTEEREEREERNEERVGHLVLYLTHACLILNDRIREILDPAAEFKATLKSCEVILPKIEQVPVQLQTGKDREAMDTVLRFIEASQKLLRIYPRLKAAGIADTADTEIGDQSFDAFYSDYNTVLNELIEAFTQEDSVLIGDLLEYEILPRTEKLVDILDGILTGREK